MIKVGHLIVQYNYLVQVEAIQAGRRQRTPNIQQLCLIVGAMLTYIVNEITVFFYIHQNDTLIDLVPRCM